MVCQFLSHFINYLVYFSLLYLIARVCACVCLSNMSTSVYTGKLQYGRAVLKMEVTYNHVLIKVLTRILCPLSFPIYR